VHTWLKAVIAAESVGAVAFAIVLVAVGVLGAGMGRQEAVEAVASAGVSRSLTCHGSGNVRAYHGGQPSGRSFMSAS